MRKRLVLMSVAALLFIIWVIWGNKALTAEKIVIYDSGIPSAFNGFRIVQVSDLHNAEFGRGNNELLEVIEDCRPDIIVATGDIIDSGRTDTLTAALFVENAMKTAPVYYVTGNHEARLLKQGGTGKDEYFKLESIMVNAGANVLHGESVSIERGESEIQIIGIDDPEYLRLNKYAGENRITLSNIDEFIKEDIFTVLLSHRPELFEEYAKSGVNLVIAGHAHGGQFRLPFVGGLFAPNQGFFPRYDSGLYEKNNTKMVVSRGLGNSAVPIRFNNRPEIVVIELNSKSR